MGDKALLTPPPEPLESAAGISRPAGCGPASERPLYQRAGQRVFELFARGVCRVWCPLDLAGRHNLPREPYLICANHASHLDTLALLIATGQPFSRFAILAAHDYFFATRLRRLAFAFLLNLIPLDRSASSYSASPSSTMTAVTACRHFLNRNDAAGLILFPEGGRSVSGTIGPFRRGAALFPMRLGLPVVPVFIGGTRRLMPKGSFWLRRGTVTVRIGEPVRQIGSESAMAEVWRQVIAMEESLP